MVLGIVIVNLFFVVTLEDPKYITHEVSGGIYKYLGNSSNLIFVNSGLRYQKTEINTFYIG